MLTIEIRDICSLSFPQILHNQKNSRRWENDEDVYNCNACNKKFSMSVRKVVQFCCTCIHLSVWKTKNPKPKRSNFSFCFSLAPLS